MQHSTPVLTLEPQQNRLSTGQCYWNNNLPEIRWTEECPDFLVGISEKNKEILSGVEAEYHYLTWEESKGLVERNQIDLFQRSPLELRRYLNFMFQLKQNYGSVLLFVQEKRLQWTSLSPSDSIPFTNKDDFRILYNDWPYGIDSEITHLVIWTKFLLEDDPETGFLTKKSHDLIEDFVTRSFCSVQGIERSKVIWFKNWTSLKSVHALEHFHVMLYRAPAMFLRNMTNGDESMSAVMGDL